ncbi:MAG: alpha-N-arabinofuranosidase [Phycisphaerae bacterium]|nr:alpha-N-arabinofuranosidase [Phycisphaerae bacterium]
MINCHPSRLHTSKLLAAALLIKAFCLAVSAACAGPVELTIQASQSGKPISPDIVGVFFEDLNYAADGGLYAELIQNRSFEYSAVEQSQWGPFSFWNLQKLGGGDGSFRLANVRPVHPKNPHYAILTITRPGDGVGMANRGFDGIPLQADKTYEASFWAYQPFMNAQWGPDNSIEGRPMPVTLRLEGKDGQVLAEAEIKVAGRAWKRYSAKLKPSRTENEAHLVLLAHARGGLALDMISLFPMDTFMGRQNGLRKDLAEAIADMKPKFVRFPGGCLVHGGGIHHYYDWKDTIGPVEQRVGQRNSWGYHQTMGLGYFEYFQFSEDIGAIPLPVVAAGVCCQHGGDTPGRGQEGLPMDEMPGYIQDVLDLIEWANGPATSKWGAKRAAAGHPEPFGLKYLGVGNEDAITAVFKERFKLIYDAIKKEHPEIVVIGTVGPFAGGEDYDNGWAFAKELNLQMVDEHYYVSPQWFWDNLERYDAYDRKNSKVYVGEYAAHDRGRRNTLRSALAEAAGLTSFERNGDVVAFASYAPLLARRGHTQWTPDLIYFDSTNVYLTANYFVQQIFGQNSGDRCLETRLDAAEATKLAVSSVVDSKTRDLIVKIVNGADESAQINIRLAGLPSEVSMQAAKTLLTGPDADAVNQDGKSPAVQPEYSTESVGPVFTYTAPANSLTVFRIGSIKEKI